ncbi:MAG: cupin domain-containing protein [Spirochaetales bacterium]|nr:cupin domain-containing protein [Spirochaetales bacterium]
MPFIWNEKTIKFTKRQSPVPEFVWHTSEALAGIAKSAHLDFNIRSLDPDRFSYPYHYHLEAEELFVVLSGEATLRTPAGFRRLEAGDIVFFEPGPGGAHQLYNHSDAPCRYLDIRTISPIDVCEYPDSGKINILPLKKIFMTKSGVDYYTGEDRVRDKWPEEILKKRQ